MSVRALCVSIAVLVGGCNGPLTPTETCRLSIDAAARCGNYTVGAFGGGTQAEDVTLCAQQVAALDAHCRSLAARTAQCAYRAACVSVTCDGDRINFDRDCRGP
jgi:hypothetical protein